MNEKQNKLNFKVRVSSDTSKAVELINESDIDISVNNYLRPSPQDCYVKKFSVYAVLGEEEAIIGSCTGYFVNGKAMAQNHVFLEKVSDALLPAEAFFDAHDIDYMKKGVNFIQLTDIHVLPWFQKQGLGTWLFKEAPDIASLYLGFSFDWVFVPFEPSIFASEKLAVDGDKLGKHRLISARKKNVTNILNKLGYEVELSTDIPVFYQRR